MLRAAPAARSASATARRLSAAALPSPLAPFLEANGVVVGDGGLGTALGADAQRHALWGAQLLFTAAGHAQVSDAHRAFLAAGADILSANSYLASHEAFNNTGAFAALPGGAIVDPERQRKYTKDVLRASVELAKQTRYQFWQDERNRAPGRLRPLVAASVGPSGDSLAFVGASDPSTWSSGAALPGA